ncbi:MAG: adenylate/guanylate cyclase domain-containing protein [Pseudomonadota bacterium]
MERRLAAILAADVAGYTALMGADEAGTLQRLTDLRREFLEPLIAEHRGRVVKLMGDGLLVEFPSVVDAVACSLVWQNGVTEREGVTQEDKRLRFRIGINLGDVIVDDGDIHGDGVNIAARLEALAEPGGICLSSDAHRYAKGKVDAAFEDFGEHTLKNVAEPVRVYQVIAEGVKAGAAHTAPEPSPFIGKPSIAVLPLSNLTGDPAQELLCDGIAEDVITELSRLPIIQVVGSHTSFALKGAKLEIREIGRKLGAHYVLGGSLRRAVNRVRISVQLIDTETGNPIWAERYDRELDDVFAVQDDVTRRIAALVPGRIQGAVADRASRKNADQMTAFEFMLLGKSIRDAFSAEATLTARGYFEKAIELDPRYAKAYGMLGDTHLVDYMLGLADENTPQLILDLTRKSAALDATDVSLQEALGFAYLAVGRWEEAESQFDRTLSQIDNQAEQMLWCGYGLMMVGRPEDARDISLKAKELDPMHPPSFDWALGQAHYFAKDYEEATQVLRGEAMLNSLAYCCLAAAYGQMGRTHEAANALEAFVTERKREFEGRNITPDGDTVMELAGGYRCVLQRESDWEHLADGLHKAGLQHRPV